MENGMEPQAIKNIDVLEQPAERGISHKRTMIFRQLRMLRWPDLPTLLGLLCGSSSAYCSYKGLFTVAYALLLSQFIFDYADGKLARTVGAGVLGVYLDSFSDFMMVTAAVVFGWFVGIDGLAMHIAGFLNIGAAAVRLAYFTAHKANKQKGFTGVPTVLAAIVVSTIAYLGYLFAKANIGWFVVFYYASAVAMISDLRLKKI